MTKAALRKKYKLLREQLTETTVKDKSVQIIEQLLNQFDFSTKTVSLFLPIQSKKEINTYPLLEYFIAVNARIGLPVSNFEANQMEHLLYTKDSKIQTNTYGIPEPQEGDKIENEAFDYVIVPLLAVDLQGNRTGYGKGFYDRFLSQCKKDCTFIGLHLFEPEPEIIETDENDIPLHFIVTPTAVYNCLT